MHCLGSHFLYGLWICRYVLVVWNCLHLHISIGMSLTLPSGEKLNVKFSLIDLLNLPIFSMLLTIWHHILYNHCLILYFYIIIILTIGLILKFILILTKTSSVSVSSSPPILTCWHSAKLSATVWIILCINTKNICKILCCLWTKPCVLLAITFSTQQ